MPSQIQSWFDDDTLKIPTPIKSERFPNGKVYTIQSPSYETGLLLQGLGSIASRLSAGLEVDPEEAKRLKFDDDQEVELNRLILGETLDEMLDDGVRYGTIKRVVSYVFTYYALSPEAAERLIGPKAQAPKPKPKPKRKR